MSSSSTNKALWRWHWYQHLWLQGSLLSLMLGVSYWLWQGGSARAISLTVGILFLLLGILRLQSGRPLSYYLPGFSPLYQYEKKIWGDAFTRYYEGGSLFFLFCGLLWGLQAWLQRNLSQPWLTSMPPLYWWLLPLATFLLAGGHGLRVQRGWQRRSPEEWLIYIRERQLLLRVILAVLTILLLLGCLTHYWLTHFSLPQHWVPSQQKSR